MNWQITFTSIAKKRIAKIPQPHRKRILNAITMLEDWPSGDVKPLKGCDEWRLRVGSWRIIFSVDFQRHTIEIRYVDTRGDVYKH